jgi:hypothetical protein
VVKAVQATRDGEAQLAKVERDMNAEGERSVGIFGRLRSAIGGVLSGAFGGGGGLASLGSVFGSGGGIGAFFTSVGGIIVVLSTLTTGLGGLVPMLVAAAGGIVSFGALAYPVISRVLAGFTAITGAVGRVATDKAWDAIPKAMQPAVQSLLNMRDFFGQMVQKMAPTVLKLLGEGLGVVAKLLPDLLKFAEPTAKAIGKLLNELSRGISSKGFKDFTDQMAKLSGPAIKVLGEGLGKVAAGIGQVILALMNPNMLRATKYFFDIVAGFLKVLAGIITGTTEGIVYALHKIAVAFDTVRHPVAAFADATWKAMKGVAGAFVSFGRDVWGGIFDVIHAVETGARAIGAFELAATIDVDKVAAWFGRLPGMIGSALSALPGEMYQIGVNILAGLLHGLESMGGSIISYVSSLGGSLISAVASKLGIGSPSKVTYQHGVWLAEGLASGMLAGRGKVAAAARQLAGAAGLPGGAGAGGGLHITWEITGGGGGNGDFDRFMAVWIRRYVRVVAGGDVQKAFGRP